MNEFVLEVNDVVKDFAKHRALDHVSMQVPKGKIYGLLGPNGAGKTTLIRILNRITAPDSGTIIFEGKPFEEKDLNNIGYLPEERGLYPKMKVGEHAIYLARLKGLSHNEAKRRIEEWFEKMDIMPWWGKKVRELSKGMQQKVQFICTIIHKPNMLIFDEPFSGFDPVNAEILKKEILALRDQGQTIIFSTHNMQSVEELCDNITLINKSKVVLQGDVQLIKRKYMGDAYQINYRREILLTDEDREKFIIKAHEVDRYGHTTLKLSNPQNIPPQQLIEYWNKKGEITLAKEELPSMHEIFLDVVEKSGGAISQATSEIKMSDK